MTETEIRVWIDLIGETAKSETGVEWVEMTCPLAQWEHESGTDSTPSHGIQVGPGESRTHCWSCHFGGDQMDLLLKLQEHDATVPYGKLIKMINDAEANVPFGWEDGVYEDSLKPNSYHIYPDYFLDITEPAYAQGIVHAYLTGRGVSYNTAVEWDLRWDSYRRRVCVPVRDFEGRLRGLHGRAVDPNANLKYLAYPHEHKANAHIFLGEHRVNGDQAIVLPESMFDLFRVFEVYPNVLSPLKAGMSKAMVTRLESASRIITIFDGDKAGSLARERLDKLLPNVELIHGHLPQGQDAGETDLQALAEALAPYI